MPREPEGKILNFLGVIPIDLRMARNPIELQFSRKAGTSVMICWRKTSGFSELAEWDRFIDWTNEEINR
jgi:hypothetical protein